MKENLTEIVFVLDRSGSMFHLVQDTIGGYNAFLESQKQEDGEAVLTTVLFDDSYKILHDRVNIQEVKPLTEKEYFARGLTALYDALGKTINTIGERLHSTKEEDRPSKVIFIITTDGEENASREFARDTIKNMVETQKNIYNWEFIFLGANIDAFGVGSSLGIKYNANYSPTDIGTRSLYTSVNSTVSNYRQKGTITEDWDQDIQ